MGFQAVQSVSTGALHGMLTTLEQARAQELCRGRRKRTFGTEPEKSEKSLSPCLSGAESPRPRIEVTGLHQPSSHDSPDVPKNPQQSSDFSCISVDQPPRLEKPPALAPRVLTVGDSPPILGRRKSLDNLRADCDAMIAAPTQASPFSKRNSTGMAALPTMGWFLLSLVGILESMAEWSGSPQNPCSNYYGTFFLGSCRGCCVRMGICLEDRFLPEGSGRNKLSASKSVTSVERRKDQLLYNSPPRCISTSWGGGGSEIRGTLLGSLRECYCLGGEGGLF